LLELELSLQVAWNPHEKTWDCPCHGSFYDCKGRIVQVHAALIVDSQSGGQTQVPL
jgi:Rieske [2Fe-2S] domain